jgi:uncharacterized protein YjbJ (UPF0337 family)
MRMNLNHIEANWKQFTGELKRRWSKLADQQLDLLTGKRRRPQPLAGKQAGEQHIPPPK